MPRTIYICTQNDIFQKFETLKRNRYKRHREKAFIVEGVKSINLAISCDWNIIGLIYTNVKPPSPWLEQLLMKIPADRYILTPELMDVLSDKEEPSEVIALVKFRDDNDLESIVLPPDRPPFIVAFDRPQNPGNLGTVIRSGSCFGADALIICGHCADMYDPQTIRSSIGAFFALPTIHVEGFSDLLAYSDKLRVKWSDLKIIGTSAKSEVPIGDMDFTGGVILCIGNETDGLSRAFKEGCDQMATIPIGGAASSLNAGCAASICLYEISRQLIRR